MRRVMLTSAYLIAVSRKAFPVAVLPLTLSKPRKVSIHEPSVAIVYLPRFVYEQVETSGGATGPTPRRE
jgi:hypothetical protein